jgi:hypothetical protein
MLCKLGETIMASGSYFLILKDTDKYLTSSELFEYNKKQISYDFNFCNQSDEELILKLQETQRIPKECDIFEDDENSVYYSKTTGKIYQTILRMDFLSEFVCLKEYFEMNPYNINGEIEINSFTALLMLQAVKYIKNPDLWSNTIESTLFYDNPFIKVFDELSSRFMYRNDKNTDNLVEDEFYSYAINNLIDVLSTYFVLNKTNDKQIKLVYKTW